MTIERFLQHVVRNENGCLIWQGAKTGKLGYAHVVIGHKHWRGHRLIWELENGTIPDGMEVCHTCDTPACLEITHLFLGTHLQNMRDAACKKRLTGPKTPMPLERYARGDHQGLRLHPESAARGDRNGRAKLTESDVIEIRALGLSHREIARRYGLSKSTVSGIIARETWKHVA